MLDSMLNYLAKSLEFRFPSNFSFSAEWMKPSAPTQAGRAGRTILVVDDEAPILHCIRLIATIETAGRVTEVCKFSRLEDQIIILVSIPSITGEEGASHCLDSVAPTGTVKVAGLIPLLPAFKNSAIELMADRHARPENLRCR
jgi:hypothetical protein